MQSPVIREERSGPAERVPSKVSPWQQCSPLRRRLDWIDATCLSLLVVTIQFSGPVLNLRLKKQIAHWVAQRFTPVLVFLSKYLETLARFCIFTSKWRALSRASLSKVQNFLDLMQFEISLLHLFYHCLVFYVSFCAKPSNICSMAQ